MLLSCAALAACWLLRPTVSGRSGARIRGDPLVELAARHHATADGWTAAAAGFHEAIELARDTGHGTDLAAALAGLCWLEARQGKGEECRAHAHEAQELAAALGVATHHVWTFAALGDLELGAGDLEAALEHLREQQAMLDRLGIDDVDLSPIPDLVEALVRLGDREQANRLTGPYVAAAVAKGQPWSAARAARYTGLLAADDALDPPFERALALHAQTPDVFERARTQLAYGARLRRARRRIDAREQLRVSLETFERLGAIPWVEQAAAELAATGETARRRDVSTLDQLTARELQVALLLSRGLTTRVAAGQLFLSPKTVEYHLRHVYQKLGVGSRTELATIFESGSSVVDHPVIG